MQRPLEAVPETMPIFSDKTISDYNRLVLAIHPNYRDEAREQEENLKRLDRFDVVSIETTPDVSETQELINEAVGNIPAEAIVAPVTGDGSTESSTRAVLGNGALFWKQAAGYANSIGRETFPRRHRDKPEVIVRKGRIARTKAISCIVTDENGALKYDFVVLDEVGLGQSAAASEISNELAYRDDRGGLSRSKQLLADARVMAPVVQQLEPFSIKFGNQESLPAEADDREVVSYRQLFYTNIGHIAKIGIVRGIHLTDAKMLKVGHSSKTSIGTKLFFGRLFTGTLGGENIPDGESGVVEFDMITPTIMEKSGDHYNLASGDHIRIARTPEEVLVYSTRRRP